ncbi:MAG TPA: hypothetical protein V6D19_06555 [Stenomitos sp.]
MDMLLGLRKTRQWRSPKDLSAISDSQFATAIDDPAMEDLGEKVLCGTEHHMSNLERYEFMKNRETKKR